MLCGPDDPGRRRSVGRLDADAAARISESDLAPVRRPNGKVAALVPKREASTDSAVEVVEPGFRLGSGLSGDVGDGGPPGVGREGDGEEVRGLPDAAELLPVDVEPRELAPAHRTAALKDEPPRPRDGVVAEPAKRLEQDALGDRHGPARDLQARRIERLGHEVAFANEEKVPGLGVPSLAVLPGDEGRLAGREVEDLDGALLVFVRRLGSREVEKALPVRKEEGQAVRRTRLVGSGQRCRRSAGRRNFPEPAERGGGEDDDVVDAPARPAAVGGLADRLHDAAGGRHPLQFPLREEADGAAVGRPERDHGVVGAWQRLDAEPVHPPDPERVVGRRRRSPRGRGSSRRARARATRCCARDRAAAADRSTREGPPPRVRAGTGGRRRSPRRRGRAPPPTAARRCACGASARPAPRCRSPSRPRRSTSARCRGPRRSATGPRGPWRAPCG